MKRSKEHAETEAEVNAGQISLFGAFSQSSHGSSGNPPSPPPRRKSPQRNSINCVHKVNDNDDDDDDDDEQFPDEDNEDEDDDGGGKRDGGIRWRRQEEGLLTVASLHKFTVTLFALHVCKAFHVTYTCNRIPSTSLFSGSHQNFAGAYFVSFAGAS